MPEAQVLNSSYTIQGSYGELHKVTNLTSPAGTDEVQSVEVGGATGGTLRLTFNGQTTAAIAFDATAAVVVAALEALTNVAPGDVVGGGGPLNTAPVTLTFGGAWADRDVPQITADGSLLVGAGAAVTTATTTPGTLAGTRQFLANMTGVDGRLASDRLEIRRSGTRRMGYKRGMISGDGTFTGLKVTSEFLSAMVDEFHNELLPPPELTLDVVLDDPEALGTEVLQLQKVKIWEVPFGWSVGDLVEESIPFTFEDAELLQEITGTMVV